MDSFMLQLIANSSIGHFSTQFLWSAFTVDLRICPIEQFTRSVASSVSGWNDVNIRSLAPNSRCTSRHQREVNFESLSETIDIRTLVESELKISQVNTTGLYCLGIRCVRKKLIVQVT